MFSSQSGRCLLNVLQVIVGNLSQMRVQKCFLFEVPQPPCWRLTTSPSDTRTDTSTTQEIPAPTAVVMFHITSWSWLDPGVFANVCANVLIDLELYWLYNRLCDTIA